MVDVNTLFYYFVIVSLSVILIIIGIWVVLILAEARKTVQKTNKILDQALLITEHVEKPVGNISSLVNSITSALSFIKIFRNKEEENE